ncbi:hypothetical protein GBA52_005983 [Prunus armeniaca]|nr:hypothetical protein GBA52_005983 [Prunus armeniaca]
MYSKCGSITDAETSFICIRSPNVVALTALINGYAQYGLGSEAMLLFGQICSSSDTGHDLEGLR